MSPQAPIAIYSLLAFAAVLMTLLGALTFVDAARKGSRESARWTTRDARVAVEMAPRPAVVRARVERLTDRAELGARSRKP